VNTHAESLTPLSVVGSVSDDAPYSLVRRAMVRATSASLAAPPEVKTRQRATSIWWSIWIVEQVCFRWRPYAGNSRRYLESLLTLLLLTASELGSEKWSNAKPSHYEFATRRRAPRRHC